MAGKESGERLSHAVGCAFAICLEKKQKRDKECAVQMKYCDQDNSFTRFGSFRQGSISERLADPQVFRPADLSIPDVGPVSNPNAIARPRASDLMYTRQASFRGLGQLSGTSPFKRQHSLRLEELPSTLARRVQDNKHNIKPEKPAQDLISDIREVNHEQENIRGRRGPLSFSSGGGYALPQNNFFSPISEDPNIDIVEETAKSLDFISIDPFSPTSSHNSSPGPMSLPSCLSPSPHPTTGRSPLPPLMENPKYPETTLQAHEEHPQEPCNPWDLVPDQPKLQQSPRPPQVDSWLSQAPLLLPSRPPSLTANRESVSVDQYSSLPFPAPSYPSLERPTSSNSTHSTASKISSAILEDPFDAEWATLATRNNNTRNTNPFINDARGVLTHGRFLLRR